MERNAFKLPIRRIGATKYPCPHCGKGTLRIKKDCFSYVESKASAMAHSDDYWDPEWIDYVFSCLFECLSCKGFVSASGTGEVTGDYYFNEHGGQEYDYYDYFHPKYFTPNLKLFDIPKKCPEQIVLEINKSFSLIFCDPASAANHVRMALEHLLTCLKIKRFTNTNGHRSFLSLHQRINLLPRKLNELKEIFLAVKWLGNAGSHVNHEITYDDVIDSYELVNELLLEIYTKRGANIRALAKEINRTKGPKKKARKKNLKN